jgi:hypothetical protein
MATYMTCRPVRFIRNRLFASIDRSNSLSASILAGFGMFGLAASGMCFAVLAQSCPQVPQAVHAESDKTGKL